MRTEAAQQRRNALRQAEDGLITPVAATRAVHNKLVETGATAVNVVFLVTTRAFDLVLPRLLPTAQSAL